MSRANVTCWRSHSFSPRAWRPARRYSSTTFRCSIFKYRRSTTSAFCRFFSIDTLLPFLSSLFFCFAPFWPRSVNRRSSLMRSTRRQAEDELLFFLRSPPRRRRHLKLSFFFILLHSIFPFSLSSSVCDDA